MLFARNIIPKVEEKEGDCALLNRFDSRMTIDVKDHFAKNNFDEIERRLNRWVDCFYRLEDECLNNGDKKVFVASGYDRSYGFIKTIGESVYNLNVSNSMLISSLEAFLRETYYLGFDEQKDLKVLVRYMRFYNNLIASKVKYYFFRETPIPAANYPFMSINKEVVKAFWSVLALLSSGGRVRFTDLINEVYKYYYYQGLTYSFIFNNEKEYGVFLGFDYSQKDFYEINERVDAYLRDLLVDNGLVGIKMFIAKYSCSLMNYYIGKYGLKVADDYSCFIRKPGCFNDFCDLLAGESFFVEPLSFRLIDVLWKLNGVFAMERKNLSSPKKNDDFNNLYNKKLADFVCDYLHKVRLMYDKNVVNFTELYVSERKLFLGEENDPDECKGVYKMIFREEPVGSVKRRLGRQADVVGKSKLINDDSICLNKRVDNQLDLGGESENSLKIVSLIETLDISALHYMLYNYALMVKSYSANKIDDEYVAFYKSGVFLAHIVNLILEQRKRVWLFSARPYVATHPLHSDDNPSTFNRVLLFDESVKTGFTYTLYESYVQRNISNPSLKVLLLTLFDFCYYDRMLLNNHDSYDSLYKVEESLAVTPKSDSRLKSSDDCFNYRFDYKHVEKIFKSLAADDDDVDLVYVLSDTDSLLSVCSDFADLIDDSLVDKSKKIVLFSPSENGDVLAMMTAFLLKSRGRKISLIYDGDWQDGGRDECHIVGVDLSINTGFSMDYRWSIISKKGYRCDPGLDYLKKISDNLDLVLAMYTDKKIIFNNIKVLYVNANKVVRND